MSGLGHKTGSEGLTSADYRALKARWITPEWAERAGVFRVDCQVGANLVGRNGKLNYAGLAIPYVWPGVDAVREYLLRRDEPDYERRSDGSLRAIKKYLAPPGRNSLLYFQPGTDPAWLEDVSVPVILVEGAFKAIALARYFAERGEKALVIAVSGVWNWRGVIETARDANGKRVDVKGPIPDLNRIAWRGRSVTILFDRNVNDNDNVRAARAMLATELRGRGATVSFVELPADFQGNGVDDFLAERGPDAMSELLSAKPAPTAVSEPAVNLDDFYAYMPMHQYLFIHSREMWPASSVNARIRPIATGGKKKNGDDVYEPASAWLDRHRSVEQMTWAPGETMLIRDRLISEGGWIERAGCATFNLYRAPIISSGDATLAGPWLDHFHSLYPNDVDHIARWLAHRLQYPAVKINHAVVLGGRQGIGKDSLLEPVKIAVGPWNFIEVSPIHLIGQFNGFVKAVILRVSEARDLGDVDRYSFYEHLKVYTAAPPDVLRCNEKNLREHSVLNCCGVVITTNHKTDGIYLPADDRRHYVSWSDLDKNDFPSRYWSDLYRWYEGGGYRHVGAYLAGLDISDFDPKAPPPKTAAFWEIVDANRSPEDAELADVLDALNEPDAVTLDDLADKALTGFRDWLRDRKNRRQIPHRLESVGYVPVRNPNAESDGLWKVGGRRMAIYAKATLTLRDRIDAASKVK